MDKIAWALYGNIYSETYEHYSDGGPKCYNDMNYEFRLIVATISTIFAILMMNKLWPVIAKSKELNTQINAKPNIIEIIIGGSCWFTFLVQLSYKLYTGRGVFMNNPCHIVLLMQGFVLLTKKTKFSAVIFIFSLRWLYGVFSALVFPVTTGMELPLEVEFFWIEHLLGAFVGPLTLTLSGRFLHFEWRTFFQHQYFGWCSHILYQRVYMLPLSLLTWANLNYTLCRPDSDPLFPIIGNWYYVFAEFYLNIVSVIAVFITLLLSLSLRFIVKNDKIDKIDKNDKKQK